MGAALSCQEFGTGTEPLLCIHGWCCESGQFAALGEVIGGEYRLICSDLPGHGKTPLGEFRPGFQEYADAVADFAVERGLSEAPVLGHSMGGIVALMAAGGERFRPRAVVNLDGSFPAAARARAGQEALRRDLGEPHFREWLAIVLREYFFLPTERDARCDAIIAAMCAAPEAVIHFLPEQIVNLDAEPTLARLRQQGTPVCYVASAAPRFDAERAMALLPSAVVKTIPHAGHFLHIYAAREVAQIVQEFLRVTVA
jgi:pimeloyl-ACP methyl ester carboxylesterase